MGGARASGPVPRLRRLGPPDAAAYKALRDATLRAHPTAFTSDADEEAARSAESYHTRFGSADGDPANFTLGAFLDDDALAGAITAERERRAKVRHKVHLTGMMVAEGRHGLGLGRALLTACVDALRNEAEGVTLVTLTVTAGNDAAIGLYERFGFARCGTLPRAIRVEGRYFAKDEMALLL